MNSHRGVRFVSPPPAALGAVRYSGSMKALLLSEYGRLDIVDVPMPRPAAGEILVRVEACGICGSDVHGYDGASGRRIPPLIMGHEAAGTVAALGPRVAGVREGDRVTFDSTIYCGECEYCRKGEVNLCNSRQVLGVSTPDFRREGAFAEYVVVPERVIYGLPASIPFEQAAMIEPLAVAVHAVSLSKVTADTTALVVGAGMIGLLVLQVLRDAGCKRVFVADIDDTRLSLATDLGATSTMNARTSDTKAQIDRLTSGAGVDAAFEAVGSTPTVKSAIENVRKGGHVTLIGNVSPNVEIPLQAVVSRELTLQGSAASSGEYPKCIELLARGAIRVDQLITAVAPLEQGAEWFQRLHDREPNLMKVILTPRSAAESRT
jgi:L-iditol 2-dehydrogenase